MAIASLLSNVFSMLIPFIGGVFIFNEPVILTVSSSDGFFLAPYSKLIGFILIIIGVLLCYKPSKTAEKNQSLPAIAALDNVQNNIDLSSADSDLMETAFNEDEQEFLLLSKFGQLFNDTMIVEIKEIAKKLVLTEEKIVKLLKKWQKELPFNIQDDSVVVDDIETFKDTLNKKINSFETLK
jgi:hypothetical protein